MYLIRSRSRETVDGVVVTTGRRLVSISPKVDKYLLLPLRISAYQPGLDSKYQQPF